MSQTYKKYSFYILGLVIVFLFFKIIFIKQIHAFTANIAQEYNNLQKSKELLLAKKNVCNWLHNKTNEEKLTCSKIDQDIVNITNKLKDNYNTLELISHLHIINLEKCR